MFARKKIWVCETCCRQFNMPAREVFEAAEARQVSELCSLIFSRIETLEKLIDSIEADNFRGAGGGEEEHLDWEISGQALGAGQAEEEGGGYSGRHRAEQRNGEPAVQLPNVSGALRRDLRHVIDDKQSTSSVLRTLQEYGEKECRDSREELDRPTGESHPLPQQRKKWETVWSIPKLRIKATYPVTEVPAPCTRRVYDALNKGSARIRESNVGPADGCERQWWRPAGRQGWDVMPPDSDTGSQGWEAAAIAKGFKLPAMRPLEVSSISNTFDSSCGGVRVHVKQQQAQRIPGLTPRARWFQPRVSRSEDPDTTNLSLYAASINSEEMKSTECGLDILGMLQRVQSHLDTPTALKNPAKGDERAQPQRAKVSMRSHAKLTSTGTAQVCHQLSTLLNVLPPLSPSCHQAHVTRTYSLTAHTLE
jgi:hypothetical protein